MELNFSEFICRICQNLGAGDRMEIRALFVVLNQKGNSVKNSYFYEKYKKGEMFLQTSKTILQMGEMILQISKTFC